MPDRQPAFFLADSLGLDFLNSIATPIDEPVDWLGDGEGFVAWLAEADLVPRHALKALSLRAAPGELDAVAAEARALRAWFGGFVRRHMGRPLDSKTMRELGPLNALLERGAMFSRIEERPDADGGAFELQTIRRWQSPESLLLPIGEALARCVCDEDFAAIRACEGERCTLIFADHTRRRARRWCSMATCGNRAKQKAHRHRLRA